MRMSLSITLPIPAAEAWALVRTPALLEHVAKPLVRFRPVDPPAFPTGWSAGAYRVRAYLFGVLPLGWQVIRISFPRNGSARHQVRDDGHGLLSRRWDHLITIAPAGDGACRYVDDVEVAAGPLTPFVWAFARLFYVHRQRRWRTLAADAQHRARLRRQVCEHKHPSSEMAA